MKNFKPLTKTEIKREVKKKITALRKIYNELDNLMDDTENSIEGMTERELTHGKGDDFNNMACLIKSASTYTELAYDDLEMI